MHNICKAVTITGHRRRLVFYNIGLIATKVIQNWKDQGKNHGQYFKGTAIPAVLIIINSDHIAWSDIGHRPTCYNLQSNALFTALNTSPWLLSDAVCEACSLLQQVGKQLPVTNEVTHHLAHLTIPYLHNDKVSKNLGEARALKWG